MLATHGEDLSSNPQNPCKAGQGSMHICNCSVPVGRWEAEAGGVPEAQTRPEYEAEERPCLKQGTRQVLTLEVVF